MTICSVPGSDITVAYLPGIIAMVSSAGNQFFSNPNNLDECMIGELFPTVESVEKAAMLYTDGVTNKHSFMVSIERAHDAQKLTHIGYAQLADFIKNCDCPPNVVTEKLKNMGFGWLLPDIEYAAKDPKLEATVSAMWQYVLTAMDGWGYNRGGEEVST